MALPIFPDRLQSSIVGRNELNFRVRNGNGWTLALISTNYIWDVETHIPSKLNNGNQTELEQGFRVISLQCLHKTAL